MEITQVTVINDVDFFVLQEFQQGTYWLKNWEATVS